jgi:hypothetical protein
MKLEIALVGTRTVVGALEDRSIGRPIAGANGNLNREATLACAISESEETVPEARHEARPGIRFNEHIEGDGPTVFAHACKLGLEGIVSKRKDSAYRSGRSPDWLKMKNPDAPAVKREEEEDWGKDRWR